jgi:Xaa-Pro aminopeptidase
MVTSVEPGIYVAGRFGVRLEDIVVVRGEGAEILGAPAGARSVE